MDYMGGREDFSEEAVFELTQINELAGEEPEPGKALGKGRTRAFLVLPASLGEVGRFQ